MGVRVRVGMRVRARVRANLCMNLQWPYQAVRGAPWRKNVKNAFKTKLKLAM